MNQQLAATEMRMNGVHKSLIKGLSGFVSWGIPWMVEIDRTSIITLLRLFDFMGIVSSGSFFGCLIDEKIEHLIKLKFIISLNPYYFIFVNLEYSFLK